MPSLRVRLCMGHELCPPCLAGHAAASAAPAKPYVTTQLYQAAGIDGAADATDGDPAAITETAEEDARGAVVAAAVHAFASAQQGE